MLRFRVAAVAMGVAVLAACSHSTNQANDNTSTLNSAHVDSVMGLSLRYPRTWKLGGQTGTIIHLTPPGDPHFFVEVVMDSSRDFASAVRDWTAGFSIDRNGGAVVDISSLEVAGHPGKRFSIDYPANPTTPIPDWCPNCHTEIVMVDWRVGTPLQITVQADDDVSWSRYSAVGTAVIGSMGAA